MWEESWKIIRAPLITLSVMALVTGIALWAMHRVKSEWRRNYREPFYNGILRPPGWGCNERLHEAFLDLAVGATTLPILWAFISYLFVRGEREDAWGFTIVGIPTSLMLIRLVQDRLKTVRMSRLGFLGECAVAENLAVLSSDGWRVFHDVPMAGNRGRAYNIDHVAVGPGGVVAVETKKFRNRGN